MDRSKTLANLGTGLEYDSSANIRVASSLAGTALTGGSGSALSVVANETTITTASGSVAIKDSGITNTHVSSSAGISRTKLGSPNYENDTLTGTSANGASFTTLSSGTIAYSFASGGYDIFLKNGSTSAASYIKLTRISTSGNSYVELKLSVGGSVTSWIRLGGYLAPGEEMYFAVPMLLESNGLTAITASSTVILLEAATNTTDVTATFTTCAVQVIGK